MTGPKCVSCGAVLLQGASFCHVCGAKVVTSTHSGYCTACGTKLPEGARFCPSCGKPVEVSAELPEPAHSELPSGPYCALCRHPVESGEQLCPKCGSVILPRPDYSVPLAWYQAEEELRAASVLRRSSALTKLAEKIAEHLGKGWLEAQFLGSAIQVGTNQYPEIFELAVGAARALGIPKLPRIYISGQNGWESVTFGTREESFIVVGTFLANRLNKKELLFVLGRELAHVAAGHTYYRTISMVMAGRTRDKVLSGGLMELMDPRRIVSLSFQVPLTAWLRATELTADRAGLLVCGELEVAERALLLKAVKSPAMLKNLNVEEYLRQQEQVEERVSKLSEYFTQSVPFLTRRIRELRQYASSEMFLSIKKQIARPKLQSGTPKPEPKSSAPKRVVGNCPKCSKKFALPLSAFGGRGTVTVKCNGCGAMFRVRRPGGGNP